MFEDPKHLFEYNVNSLHSNNSNIELMHFSSLKGFHLQEFFSLCFLHIKTSFLIASTRYNFYIYYQITITLQYMNIGFKIELYNTNYTSANILHFHTTWSKTNWKMKTCLNSIFKKCWKNKNLKTCDKFGLVPNKIFRFDKL
jgi:hypothetical protein